MARYHFNPESGEIGHCHAQFHCPFGGKADHYSSEQEAHAAYEQMCEDVTFERDITLKLIRESLPRFEAGEISQWELNDARRAAERAEENYRRILG